MSEKKKKGTLDDLEVTRVRIDLNTAFEELSKNKMVIKKTANNEIDNDIGRIFRSVNIIDYKDPTEHISIEDFHKTVAYCGLYSVKKHVPFEDITMSMFGYDYPQELIEYLRSHKGCEVNETSPGVYVVTGAMLPVQIVEMPKLSSEKNALLKYLNYDLTPEEYLDAVNAAASISSEINMDTYLDAIREANPDAVKEAARLKLIPQ